MELSKKLVSLDDQVPLELDLLDLEYRGPNVEAQQAMHAFLVAFPVDRAEDVVRIGDQKHAADGSRHTLEAESKLALHGTPVNWSANISRVGD